MGVGGHYILGLVSIWRVEVPSRKIDFTFPGTIRRYFVKKEPYWFSG